MLVDKCVIKIATVLICNKLGRFFHVNIFVLGLTSYFSLQGKCLHLCSQMVYNSLSYNANIESAEVRYGCSVFR